MVKNITKYKKSTFAINLIKGRKTLGMSALEFSEFAGIPYPTLRDLEVGRTSGRTKTLQKIAHALNTTVDALNTPQAPAIEGKLDLIMGVISALKGLDESQLGIVLRLVERLSSSKSSPKGTGTI